MTDNTTPEAQKKEDIRAHTADKFLAYLKEKPPLYTPLNNLEILLGVPRQKIFETADTLGITVVRTDAITFSDEIRLAKHLNVMPTNTAKIIEHAKQQRLSNNNSVVTTMIKGWFKSLFLIDTNIWMDPGCDEAFDYLLNFDKRSARNIVYVHKSQQDELRRQKRRYAESARKNTDEYIKKDIKKKLHDLTIASNRLNQFARRGRLHVIEFQQTDDRREHADKHIESTFRRHVVENGTISTFISNDIDLETDVLIACRECGVNVISRIEFQYLFDVDKSPIDALTPNRR